MIDNKELLENMLLAKEGNEKAILVIYNEMWEYFESWYNFNYIMKNFNFRNVLSDLKSEFYFHCLSSIQKYNVDGGAGVAGFFYRYFRAFTSKFFDDNNEVSSYIKKRYGVSKFNREDIPDKEREQIVDGVTESTVEEEMTCNVQKNILEKYIKRMVGERNSRIFLSFVRGKNFVEVGKEEKLSGERVRQIIKQIIKRLGLPEDIFKEDTSIYYYKRSESNRYKILFKQKICKQNKNKTK